MVNKYAHVTGGADQNCVTLLAALNERGHEVSILSTACSQNEFSKGIFIEPNVTHQTRESLSVQQRAGVLTSALWNFAAAKGMRVLIRTFKPDVVHVHKLYPQISVAPVVIAARAGVPIVQTLHDYELLSASALDIAGGRVDREETRLSYRALNTMTLPVRRVIHARRVGAFIAPSRFAAARHRAELGIEATVLPYFVEQRGRNPRGFAERTGAIFVSRLQTEKGVHDVIELAGRLPEMRVLVVGYGPLERSVGEAERRLQNLEFVGRQDRSTILRLLEGARVCLMPSRWKETGGIAALEAMSVGTPVVAYASGGLAEYVSDTGGGRAVEPNVDVLVREASAIHEDEVRWRECSRLGIEGVARLHSADKYVSRLEDIYVALAGPR